MTDVIWRERPELRAPGDGVRVQGLERRGRGRLRGASPSSADRFERARSRASTPRSSTTSPPCARRCASTEGSTREIDWPENSFSAAAGARRRGRPRDAAGRSSRRCAGAASPRTWSRRRASSDVRMVITLGALLADVPHSRPVSITGLASDDGAGRAARLRAARATRARPGIVGVLHHACAEAGLPVGEPVGVGAALRGRRAQPEGRARAGARVRGHRRRGRGRAASSRARPRTTSARSPPRWRATRRSRPSSSGSRPAMDEETEENPPDEGELPSADTIAQRLPALPAPARARTGLDRVLVCARPSGGHHQLP